MNPFAKWRGDVLELIRRGRRLERIARLTELPLEVRPSWPGLDWVVIGDTLLGFSDRVRTVAARLGAPDIVEADHWGGASDRAPDLIARWTLRDAEGDVRVTVRSLMPTGCKVDPRTAYLEAQEPKLHPECAAVLRELEEVGR